MGSRDMVEAVAMFARLASSPGTSQVLPLLLSPRRQTEVGAEAGAKKGSLWGAYETGSAAGVAG